ncbi:MAG TPA: histidine--tRNA ligase [Haloplasmataceae bacterium]
MMIQTPRGTYDILPADIHKWHYVERILKDVCERYNYKEIRTPIFESTELFVRGVGESTDIVTKEMYTFLDKGNRSMTLRPEGTAPVARSYVQNKLYADPNQLTKLYYMGPMFRYERMQKGRYRQFYQFGLEALGGMSPQIDAEIIALSVEMIRELGLKEVRVAINTLGDPESRAAYRKALINHFTPVIGEFCKDCQTRLQQNPLRVLDCKVDREHEAMMTAPKMVDYLTTEAKAFFEEVLGYLDALNISYELDFNLVRGLDYYNHTVFEILSRVKGFGAQTALGGGGRYNLLVQELGGPETPGVGVAFGLERLILALEAEDVAIPTEDYLDVYVVSMSAKTDREAFRLLQELRLNGLKADKDYFQRKVKSQLRQADRANARFTVIVGDEELKQDTVIVKDMTTQEQELVPIRFVIQYLLEQKGVKFE